MVWSDRDREIDRIVVEREKEKEKIDLEKHRGDGLFH